MTEYLRFLSDIAADALNPGMLYDMIDDSEFAVAKKLNPDYQVLDTDWDDLEI